MISTIIIILLLLLFIVLGVHRGAAKTILSFAAMIAASMLSHYFSSLLAQAVYDSFIKAQVIQKLETTVAQQGVDYAVQNSMQALPAPLAALVRFFTGLFGTSPEAMQGRMVLPGDQTGEIARSIEKPLGEMAVLMLSAVFSIVLFLLLWLILRLIINQVARVFNLPVIRQIDAVLGGVFGALEGIVMVFFLANLLYLLLSIINPVALDNRTLFGGLFNALLIFK